MRSVARIDPRVRRSGERVVRRSGGHVVAGLAEPSTGCASCVVANRIGIFRSGVVGLTLLACVAACATDRGQLLTRHEYRQLVMGVEARLVIYAPSAAAAREAATAAYARMHALDAVASDWRDDSELASVVADAGGPPVPVSEDLAALFVLSTEVWRDSGGAFDPSIGPVVALWRDARETGVVPAGNVLAEARERVGWQYVEIDGPARTVHLRRAGMEVDFGGVAKGYAADAALAVLTEHGYPRSLVELGGDVVAGQPPPGRVGWLVAAGCGEGGSEPAVVLLRNAALATSGDTAQHLVVDGRRYSHIIDPRSGWPMTDRLCCSVTASEGATADALASAARVLGEPAGRALVAAWGGRLMTESDGFVRLFDSESLAGWVTTGGRYDGDARWSVEDGAIVGRVGPGGAGGLLYTEQPYRSFELELEVQTDAPFDSGVFLRMAPEGRGVQVTLDDRPDGEIGAIYSDGFLAHNAGGASLWHAGAWNHLRVRCSGDDMRIEAWLNGEDLVDYQLPAGTPGYAPTGLIGLQVHGDRDDPPEHAVRFREVRLRPLE